MAAHPDRRARQVALHPHGLSLGGEVVPLWCGAMHYWRHAPEEWGPCLDAMKAMGLRVVDTYVPWGVHEIGDKTFDFGERFPRLDVARFLRAAQERGLYAVVRPGPHINAELTHFGLPERVVWDRECQARSPHDNPVMIPMVPLAFPVPSYASEAFHAETERWFAACGAVLAPLKWPDGPIVMLQIDNEGALYFRDGPYDQDYHPDAVELFRGFLREKYATVKELRAAWDEPKASFEKTAPPGRFDAERAADLPRHLDWMEFHEHLLTRAMARFSEAAKRAGMDGLPTMHNLPVGESVTPLNPSRIAGVLDLVGLDYYHSANPVTHTTIFRRTSELATRCEGRGVPAFAAEMGAGFPPFFAPLDEKDSIYTLLAALAYGLRGYNLYMAVERDRWVGAPVDPRGVPRALADEYRALAKAFEQIELHTLRRRAPVRLVVPRALRRLARATHAFGPITPAAFYVVGSGYRESCLEDDFGLGEVAPIEAEAYLRAFERALVARGVPFAYAGGESVEESTTGAQWIVCATAGGIKADVVDKLREAQARGARVTIGPHVPVRDGAMRPLKRPLDVAGLEIEPLEDAARADALVARRIEELGLPTYPVDPADVFVAVHEDARGRPRAVFVMNPTARSLTANVSLPGVGHLEDLLPDSRASRSERALGTEGRVEREAGSFPVEIGARSVRLFRAG
jgi:beta-galactosidase